MKTRIKKSIFLLVLHLNLHSEECISFSTFPWLLQCNTNMFFVHIKAIFLVRMFYFDRFHCSFLGLIQFHRQFKMKLPTLFIHVSIYITMFAMFLEMFSLLDYGCNFLAFLLVCLFSIVFWPLFTPNLLQSAFLLASSMIITFKGSHCSWIWQCIPPR